MRDIDDFLASTTCANWARVALDGDASARRYERLRSANGQTAILMDAPPKQNGPTTPFVAMAQWLGAQGLCPPEVLKHDAKAGLILMSDLGGVDLAKVAKTNIDVGATAYGSAVDVLITLDRATTLPDLKRLTPSVAADMVAITGPFYAGHQIDAVQSAMQNAMQALAPDADTVALRDYHAENLIWRPDLTGTDRIGLLDFQDAFIAPRGYDLVSLLRDARRDVPPSLATRLTAQFIRGTNANGDADAAFACLAVQRNLRILGVFARLSKQDGKTRYLAFMPRVWRYIMNDLDHPALESLKAAVMQSLPPADQAHIARLIP